MERIFSDQTAKPTNSIHRLFCIHYHIITLSYYHIAIWGYQLKNINGHLSGLIAVVAGLHKKACARASYLRPSRIPSAEVHSRTAPKL